jgi:hypothetical protein
MGTQPCRHSIRSALGQQIDRPLLCKIHQHCAIDPPLAEGKIIDPEYTRGRLGGRWGAVEHPKDRIAAQRHPQAGGHARAGFAARFAPKDAHRLSQPVGALRVVGGKGWQAFHEGTAGTCRGATAKTSDLHAELYRMLCNGPITQAARRAAMHTV